MKYADEMASDAMMHIRSLIKIGSGTQKLIGGIRRHTDSISLLQENRLQIPVVADARFPMETPSKTFRIDCCVERLPSNETAVYYMG